MDMEGALRARLLAAAPVAAIVGQRIYWDERPQASALPAVVLEFVTDLREQTFGGFQSLLSARIQIWAFALSFGDKKRLKEAIIAAIEPQYSGNGIWFDPTTEIFAVPRNEQTDTQMIYADVIDCQIHYRPA